MFSFKSKVQLTEDSHLKSVTENLYKQNLELAVKNKTLSLLGKLYEISISSLTPINLASKLSTVIQQDFNFELVGIFLYDMDTDDLTPLAITESKRLSDVQNRFNSSLEKIKIVDISQTFFFKKILREKTMGYTEELTEVWNSNVPSGMLDDIKGVGHVRSSIVYPLQIEGKTMGIFVIGLNRLYTDLFEYEKESIKSFTNVIAVALDKSLVYEELERANVRLRELDQQKTEFISLATHQIRGPLGAIKGHAALALEGDYGPIGNGPRKAFSTIMNAAQSLVIVVSDYLDVSRIEQGRMNYDFSEFDLKDLVKEEVNEFLPTLAGKSLTLELICDQSQMYTVWADKGKIKQVFGNLIDNSVKYTPKGHIRVCLEKKNKKLLFSVSDNGVGIRPEVIPNLFAKFSRAPDANKTNILGTGLGLFVARKMIEAHKGKVWAESEGSMKGSAFYVELDEKI